MSIYFRYKYILKGGDNIMNFEIQVKSELIKQKKTISDYL